MSLGTYMRASFHQATLTAIALGALAWSGAASAAGNFPLSPISNDAGDIYVADPSDSYVVEAPAPTETASTESFVPSAPPEPVCRDTRPAVRGNAAYGTVCEQSDGSLHMVDAAEAEPYAAPHSAQHAAQHTTAQYCREYQQTVVTGGMTQAAFGTACLQADGSWEIVTPAVASGQPVVRTPAYQPYPRIAAPSAIIEPSPRSMPADSFYAAPLYSNPAYSSPSYYSAPQQSAAPLRVAPAMSAHVTPQSYAAETHAAAPITRWRVSSPRIANQHMGRLFAWLTHPLHAESKRKAHDKHDY